MMPGAAPTGASPQGAVPGGNSAVALAVGRSTASAFGTGAISASARAACVGKVSGISHGGSAARAASVAQALVAGQGLTSQAITATYRTSWIGAEVVRNTSATKARVTSVGVEIARNAGASARVTATAVEVLHNYKEARSPATAAGATTAPKAFGIAATGNWGLAQGVSRAQGSGAGSFVGRATSGVVRPIAGIGAALGSAHGSAAAGATSPPTAASSIATVHSGSSAGASSASGVGRSTRRAAGTAHGVAVSSGVFSAAGHYAAGSATAGSTRATARAGSRGSSPAASSASAIAQDRDSTRGTAAASAAAVGYAAFGTSGRGYAPAGSFTAVARTPSFGTSTAGSTVLAATYGQVKSAGTVHAGATVAANLTPQSELRYTEYFLNTATSVVQLELVEISHPNFTQTYYVVRNSIAGVTVTLETGATQFFRYYPLKITPKDSSDDLDQGFTISFGDLGEILPTEMDAVAAADGFGTKPTVLYRTYRSDDLSAPMFGPLTLQVTTFSFTREGATFDATAPLLNYNATGELYTLDRFPGLRALL